MPHQVKERKWWVVKNVMVVIIYTFLCLRLTHVGNVILSNSKDTVPVDRVAMHMPTALICVSKAVR